MNKLKENLRKSNGRLIDETGNRYNMLKVIKYAGSGKSFPGGHDGGAAWLCECDCGNTIVATGTKLRMGVYKSCGCFWKKETGEGSFNAMYRVRVNAAKRRGIKWSLSKADVKRISKLNCEYCGLPPSNVGRGSANGEYVYSGIDRVDSNGGYEIGNVVPCCAKCNLAKASQTVDEFFNWIKRVVVHNNLL